MDTLKEIENRYYKKCNVIPIATKTSYIAKIKGTETYQLFNKIIVESKNLLPVHLYITNDDEIKFDDYIVVFNAGRDGNQKQVIKVDAKYILDAIDEYDKKIISTTDKSLLVRADNLPTEHTKGMVSLPQPSHNFIKAYCEQGGIDKVLVEYTGTQWLNKRFGGTWQPFPDEHATIRRNIPKTDSNNTITIKDIKNIYSREEVEELLIDALTSDGPRAFNVGWELDDANNWIKENL